MHLPIVLTLLRTYSESFFLLSVFIRAGNANTWAAFFEIHCMCSFDKFVKGPCFRCCNQKISSMVLIQDTQLFLKKCEFHHVILKQTEKEN